MGIHAEKQVTIPAFVNPGAGKAGEVETALAALAEIHVEETEPKNLAHRLEVAVRAGAKRIIVAGGDGTVAEAAGVLAGTGVGLGIVPAGTLNHLAKDLGIPLDFDEAARVAVNGRLTTVDVGRAGERIFLNTSSVGAYVLFVRTRERLEPRLGYWLASLVAAARIMFRLRRFAVQIEVEGQQRRYMTPLLFIGVGERELKLPRLGGRVEGGRSGLHVMIVRTRTRARLLALALAAAARGLDSVSRSPAIDAFIVERCRIELPFPTMRVAIDGEIVDAQGAIEYALWRDALHVVVPPEGNLEMESRAG